MFRYGWLVPALIAAVGVAQEPSKTQQQQGEQTAPSKETSVDDLISQLGDPSYEVRQNAEQQLRERGDAVLESLQKAAEGNADPEVRWRARRLVHQMQNGGGQGGGLRVRRQDQQDQQPLQPGAPGFGGPPNPQSLNQAFDSLFRQLEQDFGMDIPRGHFFNDPFFKDLQQQLDDAMQGPQMGQGSSFQMQMGPNGVKVTVTETDSSGKSQTQTYEAPDLQTFRQKYPQIAQRYLDGGAGMRLRVPQLFGGAPWGMPNQGQGQGQGQGLQPRALVPRPGFGFQQAPAAPPGGDQGPRLGIWTQPMSDDLRGFLGLEQEQGLLVGDVEDGSLAQKLGIQPGDVVLEIDGAQVGSPGDVRQQLVKAGDKVTVTVNRHGQEKQLEATYEHPAPLHERKQF